MLELIHYPSYVAAVRGAPSAHPELLDGFGLGGEDNPIFDGMHEASALVAGGTVDAARAVAAAPRSTPSTSPAAFTTPCRPGQLGSASTTTRPSPSPALLAHGAQRVAYVDIDVHHGDGVQAVFSATPGY